MKCSIDECIRDSQYQTNGGLCRAHYKQLYEYGRITKRAIGPVAPRPSYKKKIRKKCTWNENNVPCPEEARAKGWCAQHYQVDYARKYRQLYPTVKE